MSKSKKYMYGIEHSKDFIIVFISLAILSSSCPPFPPLFSLLPFLLLSLSFPSRFAFIITSTPPIPATIFQFLPHGSVLFFPPLFFLFFFPLLPPTVLRRPLFLNPCINSYKCWLYVTISTIHSYKYNSLAIYIQTRYLYQFVSVSSVSLLFEYCIYICVSIFLYVLFFSFTQ